MRYPGAGEVRVSVDILLGDDGDLPAVPAHGSGDDVVLQRLRLRLQLIRGDWILDAQAGVPYLQWFGGGTKLTSVADVGAYLRSVIETTPGVQRVMEWVGTFDAAAERMSFRCSILLSSGVTVQGTVAQTSTPAPSGWGGFLFAAHW